MLKLKGRIFFLWSIWSLLGGSSKAQSLDYTLDKNWYALPSRLDVADFVPDYPGVQNNQTTAEADVFYIHPTTYFKRLGRNDNFKQPSSRRITRSVVMNQATTFNQCFKIYAPKYRQTASWVLRKRDERTVQAMELAYGDIELAFDYYIRNSNQQRPFIIAAHGQGSYHALKLLERRIEGSPLQNQMVAAYLGGLPLVQQLYDSIFQTVPYCQSAEETGCLLNWQTLGESGYFQDMEDHALYFSDQEVIPLAGDRLCVNPLSWKTDSNHISAMHHTGSLKFVAKTEDMQIVMEHHLSGNVKNGYMYISKPKGSLFNAAGRNYHIYDYNIFYLNIRSNACERLQNWKLKSVRIE